MAAITLKTRKGGYDSSGCLLNNKYRAMLQYMFSNVLNKCEMIVQVCQ